MRKKTRFQVRKNRYKKTKKIKKTYVDNSIALFFIALIVIIFSGFATIKNDPELISNIDNINVKTVFNVLNSNLNSLQYITEDFVTDVDETIISGNPKTLNENQFSSIDNKAISIKYYGNSVTELAQILSQYAVTDLEKARIIYTWITNNIRYDTQAILELNNGFYPNIRTTNVLNERKTICSGYANLYQKLASAMGLKSVMVVGYAKGSNYIVGDDDKVNHAWNGVKIDGKWYLIDTTWGSGTVQNSVFKPDFNPFYFATSPDKFIYTHFPEKQKWQLLTQPYARQQFNNLPEVSGNLFKNNIQLISHKNNFIDAKDRLKITLEAPKNTVAIANLESDNQILDDHYTFVQNKNGYINVNVAFPRQGDYKLNIFAKKQDNSNYYPHVVSYNITANKSSAKFPFYYRHFTENNGYLKTPLTQSLTPHKNTFFQLKVDNATEVRVLNKATNDWHDLMKYNQIFSGNVNITSGKVVLLAKFPGDSRYWALLEYN